MENSNKNKDKNNDSKKFWISSIILLVIIIALAIVSYLIYSNNGEKENELVLPYTELIQNINNNTVEKIELTTGSTTVKVKLKDEEEEKTTIVPSLQAFTEYVQTKVEQGNEMEVIQNRPNVLLSIGDTIFTVLPTLLMIALIIMLFKMQGLGDKGKVYDSEEKDTNVRFEDVAGLDEEKEELKLLRQRNEYLEAENAYLKKVKALAIEKMASSAKAKKRKSSKNSLKKDTD